MKIEVFSDESTTAQAAAKAIASEARTAVAARGRFTLAVSGGHTPWMMLGALADEDLPWPSIHVVQVDERVAPAGHADRNLTHLRDSLLDHSPISPDHIHAMPVESPDLDSAARDYAALLSQIAGSPSTIDLVHLGLGPDGHTASLVPEDPVLAITTRDVAVTGIYQGHRRMTLTYPIINRARRILWLATGREKAAELRRLRQGDVSVPAGKISQSQAVIFADQAALDGHEAESGTLVRERAS
jgi:6-phosphogluconolactonase